MNKLIFNFKQTATIISTSLFLFSLQITYAGDLIDITTGWKFHTWNNLKWAHTDFDHSGNGGKLDTKSSISMLDLKESFIIRTNEAAFLLSGEDEFKKTIELENISKKDRYEGQFSVEIVNLNSREQVYESSWDISIDPGQKMLIEYGFNSPHSISLQALYTFEEKRYKTIVSSSQMVPYILTPEPEKAPKINGAKVYGVRPGSPLLYRIPATGDRPMIFTIQGLPSGLQVDENSGIITGKISKAGTYPVVLKAKNHYGESTRKLSIIVGSTLALTPPMGWNSWYIHYHRVSDKLMREAADAMINSGMADYGYQYVNIDDCWMVKANSDDPIIGGRIRDEKGELLTNGKFPDMKAMTNYIHSKGLKAGTYISPGPTTCAGYAGSYQHEKQDAQTFAGWGFDFLKYDWCSYGRIAKDRSIHELQKPYVLMWDELQQLDRDIVLNLCQYGLGEVWKWGDEVGNSWRTTGDLGLEHSDEMPGFYKIGISNAQHWEYAKPGAWNDPDYILIGWVGSAFITGEGRLTTLSPDEQYFYMSMWSLMASPLIFSGDMAKLDPFTLNILCNSEVIDVNQDALGKQAAIQKNANDELVMVKELEDGSKAVGLFNLDDKFRKISVNWTDLNIENKQLVRDLWRQKDMGLFESGFEQIVPPHGIVLIKVGLK